VIRLLATGAEGSGFKAQFADGIIKKAFLFIQQYICFSSELGKVKAVRRRGGALGQLHRCQYKLAMGTTFTIFT